LRWFWQS